MQADASGPNIANCENTGERRPYSLCIQWPRSLSSKVILSDPQHTVILCTSFACTASHMVSWRSHAAALTAIRRRPNKAVANFKMGCLLFPQDAPKAPALGRGQAAWQGAACGQSTLEIIGKKRSLHAAAESPGVD